MEPVEIAALLREIATYLDLDGEHFRARAYEKAARTVEASHDLDRIIAEGRLTELPGVGASLARVIEELAARGAVDLLDRLRASWPPVVVELSKLPKVGPGRARKIHEALAPRSLDELAAMCEAGQVRALPGFGRVSEARVLEAIRGRHQRGELLLLGAARDLTAQLVSHLRGCPAALRVEGCGPARRWIEVIDRLALAVSTPETDRVRDWLARHPLVVSLIATGDGTALARLASGVLCELHTAPAARFGVAEILATGGDRHVDGLRRLAGERGTALEAIDAADEAALYQALGLPLLPPEVRDGTDEIAAALAGDSFADLIADGDIAGAVHCHTVYSDGKHTVEEMARAAERLGLRYLTITDHSQTAHYAGGLTVERLREQWDEIADVQRRVGVQLLRGTESDILADGQLDYPPDVLDQLDVVIASVHQRYRLDEDAMTRRLIAALRHPVFKIWGHALGRLVLHRDPIAVRFDDILDAAVDAPVAIEINGDPRRLDLDPERARRARDRGFAFVLSVDAHSTGQLSYISNAVAMARRARLRKRDVLNTLPAEAFARAVKPSSTI